MPSFDFDFFKSSFSYVLPFLPVTLTIIFFSILFSSLFGLILARAELRTNTIAAKIASAYVFVLRSTPPIVLLFLVFYGIPKLFLFTLNVNINRWNRTIFAILALSLLYASNLSEVFKSSYLAVGSAQSEAAEMVGLSPWQSFIRITMPQTAVIALPNFTNTVAALIKDSALAYIIGIMDIVGAGNNLIARNYGHFAFETYLALAIIYWVFFILVEQAAKFSEQRLNKKQAAPVIWKSGETI
ncbi:amino acid ABC transporter permease [Eupransor demetentiae]|uniref:Permease component (HisM) n=1 Tax=Eupransor demetentiae TaxID=3109584 RepID=A0ABM9N467_9LACO|nr:ABC-type amino acid transport system [Lactobacillaceae bacterium LMG 33000]